MYDVYDDEVVVVFDVVIGAELIGEVFLRFFFSSHHLTGDWYLFSEDGVGKRDRSFPSFPVEL